ncbi:hypothetical protein N7493_009628 [Penicillium malachiteum]|uniref:Uncharacterized protein n=1 Tax=Penicillium malachiteum TaxID=1324776 RepID=A0AAD6HEI2_9EURO|nr:hypothetical protein N7493_009628 [Penicillium malachiteum]
MPIHEDSVTSSTSVTPTRISLNDIPLEKPMISNDDEDREPRFWAGMVAKNEWSIGKEDSAKAGTLLNKMLFLKPIREPVLRYAKEIPQQPAIQPWLKVVNSWDGPTFNSILIERKSRVEAMHLQAKGQVLRGNLACHCCKAGYGIFASCVVYDTENEKSTCANCCWREAPCGWERSWDYETEKRRHELSLIHGVEEAKLAQLYREREALIEQEEEINARIENWMRSLELEKQEDSNKTSD